jgi:hypothetical protein
VEAVSGVSSEIIEVLTRVPFVVAIFDLAAFALEAEAGLEKRQKQPFKLAKNVKRVKLNEGELVLSKSLNYLF